MPRSADISEEQPSGEAVVNRSFSTRSFVIVIFAMALFAAAPGDAAPRASRPERPHPSEPRRTRHKLEYSPGEVVVIAGEGALDVAPLGAPRARNARLSAAIDRAGLRRARRVDP